MKRTGHLEVREQRPKRLALKSLAMLGGALSLAGCSGAKMWSWVSRSTADAIKKDVVFNSDKGLTADIYYARPQKGTVIFVYGGSWRSGDKAMYGFLADGLVQCGYNVVIPNYRLYPHAAYPEFVVDLEQFMHWFDINAASRDLSTDKLFLMGHSAGAYNAAMYLTNARFKKPRHFDAFIGLSGPYDFFLPTKNPEYLPIFTENGPFNTPAALPVNQPVTPLNTVVTRALLLHGAADTLVTPKNIEQFTHYLERCGVTVSSKIYNDIDHKQMISAINNVPMIDHTIRDDVTAFLDGQSL